MVTPAATTIFYPETDGMPLPDALYQIKHFLEILTVLKSFFSPRKDVAVSGDNFIYYEEGNPRANFAPDCFVLIGGNVDSLWDSNRYLMWEVGKAPDFILEIGSPSTASQDQGLKRNLYASLGVVEYWRFDPSGGDHYGEPLVGETLVDGEYRELDMVRGANGGARGHSPVLNLELHWQDGRLRFYDPAARRWLENIEETSAARETERSARQTAETERDMAESRAQTAETRVAELEAELQRLRDQ